MTGASQGVLSPGQPFLTVNRRRGTVGELLGAGGQGECYQAMVDGVPFALKWYHRHYIEIDTRLRARLERAVRRGAPTDDFLWPFDLVEIEGSGSFGYFMPLRGDNYVGMRELIAPPPRRVELSLAKRSTLCLQLAHSFLELHAGGFCYQDINFGNIFFDPRTARILICDNDNVNIDGAEASIYGTRKFMAPEVVRRETLPSSRTDLYSMAVLFFYTLLGWHPLDGKREHEIALMDGEGELRLYGTEPLFLFDPNDDSNGAVGGFHDAIVARWESLSTAVRALFVRAFTDGLRDPAARVLETQWRTALEGVPDAIHACDGCGFEHVADVRAGRVATRIACLACGSPLPSPLFLLVGQHACRLALGRSVQSGAGRVETHPTRPDLVGLRNCSQATWRAGLPDGSAYPVPPGQAVRVLPGLRIDFGTVFGTILQAERTA